MRDPAFCSQKKNCVDAEHLEVVWLSVATHLHSTDNLRHVSLGRWRVVPADNMSRASIVVLEASQSSFPKLCKLQRCACDRWKDIAASVLSTL